MNYYILYIIHSLVFLQNPPEPRWNFIDFGVEAYELFGLSFVNETPVSALILPGLGEAKSQQRCPSLLSVVMGHCSGSCDAQLHSCRNPKRPTSLNHHRQRGACSCIVTSMVCSLVVDHFVPVPWVRSIVHRFTQTFMHAVHSYIESNAIQYNIHTHMLLHMQICFILCASGCNGRESERDVHIYTCSHCVYTFTHTSMHAYTHTHIYNFIFVIYIYTHIYICGRIYMYT